MIIIREATEEDIPHILQIEQEAISPPWTHGALLSEMYNNNSYFVVAYEPGSPIQGFTILRRTADEGELLQIAVKKTARRRGIAGSLISAALGYAEKNTLKSVHLEVRKGNEAAISLYEKHSFKTVRQRKDYYTTPVEDATVMVWQVGQPIV